MLRKSLQLIFGCLVISQMSACGGGGGGGEGSVATGSLEIVITDSPVDGVQTVSVQFVAVTVHSATGSEQRFEFATPRNIDLKEIVSGQLEVLVDADLPVGDYTSITLEINADLDGIPDSFVVDEIGNEFELDVLADQIELSAPFTLNVGGDVAFVIDWDLRMSLFGPGEQGNYTLLPSVRIIDRSVSGSLTGSVNNALLFPTNTDCSSDPNTGAGNQVYVYSGFDVKPDDVDNVDAEPLTIVDVRLNLDTSDQEYTANFLAPGDYTIAFTCQGSRDRMPVESVAGSIVDDLILFTPGINVSVTSGQVANADFTTLPTPPPTMGPISSLRLVNFFETGFDELTGPLTVPLIDPAGIVYYPPTGRLLIADSEINEEPAAFDTVLANLMSTSTDGAQVYNKWNLTVITGNEPFRNREPTGITYCENDDHFYVSNDDLKLIYRYSFDGSQFIAVDSFNTNTIENPYQSDPEGITCDSDTGRLYVVGGVDPTVLVLSYDNGFIVEDFLNLPLTAGNMAGVPGDAEGIAFDQGSGNFYLISGDEKKIYAYTPGGEWVTTFSIEEFVPRTVNGQGLSVGPSSDNPYTTSFYIADGLIDNDSDIGTGHGRIYEVRMNRD